MAHTTLRLTLVLATLGAVGCASGYGVGDGHRVEPDAGPRGVQMLPRPDAGAPPPADAGPAEPDAGVVIEGPPSEIVRAIPQAPEMPALTADDLTTERQLVRAEPISGRSVRLTLRGNPEFVEPVTATDRRVLALQVRRIDVDPSSPDAIDVTLPLVDDRNDPAPILQGLAPSAAYSVSLHYASGPGSAPVEVGMPPDSYEDRAPVLYVARRASWEAGRFEIVALDSTMLASIEIFLDGSEVAAAQGSVSRTLSRRDRRGVVVAFLQVPATDTDLHDVDVAVTDVFGNTERVRIRTTLRD